ncbi:MAG: class I SAM-dependent methyltransferase [Bacteroidota bacterium]
MSLVLPLKKLAWQVFIRTTRTYDKWFSPLEKKLKGVDFIGAVLPEEMGGGYTTGDYVYYVSVKRWQVKRIMKILQINKGQDSILDYGCGKGKALYEFSKYGFRKIGGVELDKELVDIAKANMKKLGLANIEIYNENGIDFKEIDDYNHFYFYDPFNAEIFSKVLENIIESMDKNPRKITLMYLNQRGHHEVMMNSKRFRHFHTAQIPMKAFFYKSI